MGVILASMVSRVPLPQWAALNTAALPSESLGSLGDTGPLWHSGSHHLLSGEPGQPLERNKYDRSEGNCYFSRGSAYLTPGIIAGSLSLSFFLSPFLSPFLSVFLS